VNELLAQQAQAGVSPIELLLGLVLLVVGYLIGRLHQWLRNRLANDGAATGTTVDPTETAQHYMSNMAASTRMAERQLRRVSQPRMRGSRFDRFQP
jgi:hypothetical protein